MREDYNIFFVQKYLKGLINLEEKTNKRNAKILFSI